MSGQRPAVQIMSGALPAKTPAISRRDGLLSVDEALPRLKEALVARNAAVLVAPPGAGKTTRVPLALLDAPWLGGRQDRHAGAAAAGRARGRAAHGGDAGEAVGETVGYRVRLDTKVGRARASRS